MKEKLRKYLVKGVKIGAVAGLTIGLGAVVEAGFQFRADEISGLEFALNSLGRTAGATAICSLYGTTIAYLLYFYSI